MFRTVELSMLWSNFLIFHSHATLKMWSVQLQFFSKKIKNPPVVMENYAFRYRVGTIFIQVLFFSPNQYFVASLTNSDFSSFVLLFNSEVSDANPVGKKPPCGDGEVWLWETSKSIWIAFIECFALAKNRCTYQKNWLSTPLILYECEVAYWDLFWNILSVNL